MKTILISIGVAIVASLAVYFIKGAIEKQCVTAKKYNDAVKANQDLANIINEQCPNLTIQNN